MRLCATPAVVVAIGCGGSSGPAASVSTPTATPTATPVTTWSSAGGGTFFDDFSYADGSDPALVARHWTLRTEAGGPGVPGARWCCAAFVDEPSAGGNRLLQLNASTDGTGAGTQQSEVAQVRKFYEGTYAARVYFTDSSVGMTGHDAVVETFFAITPLAHDLDPDYGEMDFEYLPNGGWGASGASLYLTTWETYQNDPWVADNVSTNVAGALGGWHTLLIQVAGGVDHGSVRYFVDGQQKAAHGSRFYPETPLSVNFNLWLIATGLSGSGERRYDELVDYFYYAGHEVIDTAEVESRVAAYRAAGTAFVDTVPDP